MRSLIVLALLASVAGCYRYPAVPSAVTGDSYTRRAAGEGSEGASLRQYLEQLEMLPLAEAQRIALERNPGFISSQHSVSAARMRLYQSRGEYSPVLSASFDLSNRHDWTGQVLRGTERSDSRTDTFATRTGVRAGWLLFDGFGRPHRILAASAALDKQRELTDDDRRILLRSVAYAYNAVLLAIEDCRIADEDRKFQEESLRDARHKFDAGKVAKSNVLNFEILRNNAEVRRITAEYSYETAIYDLAVMMGCEEGTLPSSLKFESSFGNTFPELPAVEIYLDSALAARPDLKAARADLQRACYLVRLAYADYFPVVKAFADFGFTTTRSDYYAFSTYRPRTGSNNISFSYGLTADLTIFNGLRRYNAIRERKAQRAAAELGVAGKWFSVVGEVRAAYANYRKTVKCAGLYQRTRDLSQKQRDLVQNQYRTGYCEITRLNEAQRDLVTAEANYASSRINILNAIAQLECATAAGEVLSRVEKKEETEEKTAGE